MKLSASRNILHFTIIVVLVLLLSLLVHAQQPVQQKYIYAGTLKDFQDIVFAISNPDDVTSNQRKEIVKKLQDGIVAIDTTKHK